MRSLRALFLLLLLAPANAFAFDFTVDGDVPALQQPGDWGCWATVTTILKPWTDKASYAIEMVIGQVGPQYLAKLKGNKPLYGSEFSDFLKAAHLIAETPQNYTIDGWLSPLKRSGPLWSNASILDPEHLLFAHARVIY